MNKLNKTLLPNNFVFNLCLCLYVGSFYSRKPPCFLEANGGRRFRLKIPYHECNVEDVGSNNQLYRNFCISNSTSLSRKEKSIKLH